MRNRTLSGNEHTILRWLAIAEIILGILGAVIYSIESIHTSMLTGEAAFNNLALIILSVAVALQGIMQCLLLSTITTLKNQLCATEPNTETPPQTPHLTNTDHS